MFIKQTNGLWSPGSLGDVEPPTNTKPSELNTGCTGTLTPYSGTYNITTPGTTIQNLDIDGSVVVSAADVIIRNCRIRGTDGGSSLIDCNSASVSDLLIEDCTLAPDVPSKNWNAVSGHDHTTRRCNISGTVDGFRAVNTNNYNAEANILIEWSYIHHLWFGDDPNQGDGFSHNDGVQIHGNGGITIRYNTLSVIPMPGYTHTKGTACVMIGNGNGSGDQPNITIQGNWFGGYVGAWVNVAVTDLDVLTTVTVLDNKGDLTLGTPDYQILANRNAAVTVPGLPTYTGDDLTNGNVIEATGNPMRITRFAT